MALIIAYKPPTQNAGRNLFLSIAAFGVATILFGISEKLLFIPLLFVFNWSI
jgi:hypothetical protein